MRQTIDAAAFQQMVIHAAAAISVEKQQVNDLNVFPVPDGDTGTNMSLTIAAAAGEMKKKSYDTVGQAAQATASALLRGARGNSGVILSLLFRGFAKAIKEEQGQAGLACWPDPLRCREPAALRTPAGAWPAAAITSRPSSSSSTASGPP